MHKEESSAFRIVSVGFIDDRKGDLMILNAIVAMKNRNMCVSYTIMGGMIIIFLPQSWE